MWNAGPTPARMIEVISPAGFEHFFRELAEIVAAGPPPTPATVPNLAACGAGRRTGRLSAGRLTCSGGPADRSWMVHRTYPSMGAATLPGVARR